MFVSKLTQITIQAKQPIGVNTTQALLGQEHGHRTLPTKKAKL